jgi:hypothetical protein
MGLPQAGCAAIDQLAEHDQWVCWRYVRREGKLTKVPVNPLTGGNARVDKPGTWGSFEKASEYAEDKPDRRADDGTSVDGSVAGLGFVFGSIDKWARWIAAKLDSYTEISPSGTGLHILVRGVLTGNRRRMGQTEVYKDGRYFTVTGVRLDGSPEEIEEFDGDLASILNLDPTDKRSDDPVPSSKAKPAAMEADDYAALAAELNPHVDPDAEMPATKFDVLCTNAPVVKDSWDHKRKDMGDQSASSYDLSLANYFLDAKWSHVEIMEGLIAHRRKHGAALKLERNPPSDYYVRTIIAAKRRAVRDSAIETLTDETLDDLPHSERVQQLLIAISEILGIRIDGVDKYLSDEPEFVIRTAKGKVSGTIQMITAQRKLKDALAATTGHIIERMKETKYDQLAQRMLDVARQVSIGKEAFRSGQAAEWLREYLNDMLTENSVYDPALVDVGEPFIKEATVYIVGSSFSMWLMKNKNAKPTQRAFGAMLRECGCRPTRWTYKLEGQGRATSRNVWELPKAVLTPPEGHDDSEPSQ